jgi:isopentenyl-diphosphate delta-isomerase
VSAASHDIVLVDARGQAVGSGEKLDVHHRGALHRAFSIFLFNARGEQLLQRRAHGKYHSGGLWTNACCGHPRPGEATTAAAARRLGEELGIEAPLGEAFAFTYRAELDRAPAEVEAWRWLGADALRGELAAQPERFTAWFRICAERVLEHQQAAGAISRGTAPAGR